MDRLKSDMLDFGLKDFRIAQGPRPHEEHRLLVHRNGTSENRHIRFDEIDKVLAPGDLLVFNNSKVFPASIYRDDATFILFTNPFDKTLSGIRAICPFKPSVGDVISFDFAKVHILEHEPGWDVYRVNVETSGRFKNLAEFLSIHGKMPMPIYLKRIPSEEDASRLQNFFAKDEGSIAPPVAGHHFSEALVESLRTKGIESVEVTLHVGYGTFRSFKTEYVDAHTMDEESFFISKEVADKIVETKKRGNRVIAVGTTASRVLESAGKNGMEAMRDFADKWHRTSIFIYPPYSFQVADGLITNFQYPRLPVLAMAAAFTGLDELRKLYDDAIAQDYLFYSYGDAMLLLASA